MKFQSVAVYALAAIAMITGQSEARLRDGRRLWVKQAGGIIWNDINRGVANGECNGRCQDEMDDEEVGDFDRPSHTRGHAPDSRSVSNYFGSWDEEEVGDFDQPSHTRGHAPDSRSVNNYFGSWDEEEEQPARRLRKKRYAMLCRFHGKAGHYTIWNKPGNLPCGGKYCCNKNDNL